MTRHYSHNEDFPAVREWLRARRIAVPDPSYLPDCGFVALGVAIGFLVKTNSKVARIENIIVDPNADEKTRNAALYSLFNALESEAKRCGYSMIEVLSGGANMTARLARCRFRKFGEYSLLYKEVT
jgi:hypothetical protein